MNRKKKSLIIGGTVIGVVAAAGAAYAALGGTILNTDVVQGIASGGSTTCQTSAMTFTFSDPAWDSAADDFLVNRVDYSGYDSQCVTNGAQLSVVVLANGTEFVNYTSTPPGITGSINLTTPMTVDEVTAATVQYLVNG